MPGKFEFASNDHINRYKMAHSIGVAEYMREHAAKYMLNPDEMYVLGLLHDIGYLEGRLGHEETGSSILANMGFDKKYIFAVKHHGENPYELEKKYGKDFISDELKLLLEADMSVNAEGFRVGFSGRLKDISERYGKDSPAYRMVKTVMRYLKEETR